MPFIFKENIMENISVMDLGTSAGVIIVVMAIMQFIKKMLETAIEKKKINLSDKWKKRLIIIGVIILCFVLSFVGYFFDVVPNETLFDALQRGFSSAGSAVLINQIWKKI